MHRPPKLLRLRGQGRNLALGLASLAVTFLLFELVCRGLVPTSPPGTTYGRPVEFNAHGFRDRDFDLPKPAGTTRLFVLGDSFTWGVGLDARETIPKRLEGLFAETGRDIEVVNAAHPGYNTVEELLRLEEMGPLYEPDLVLVVYNLNDIEYIPELAPGTVKPSEDEAAVVVEIDPGEKVTRYSRNAGLRGLVLAVERRSQLVSLLVPRVGMILRRLGFLDSAEFSWVEKIYQGFTEENPGWRESQRALGGIAEYCQAADCAVLVAIYPLLVELDDYQGGAAHAAITDFCTARGIEAVDLLDVFAGSSSTSHWINVADSHPDADAHEAVARRLLAPLLGALENR
jgi:lysophospholipase L1-like esterase